MKVVGLEVVFQTIQDELTWSFGSKNYSNYTKIGHRLSTHAQIYDNHFNSIFDEVIVEIIESSWD